MRSAPPGIARFVMNLTVCIWCTNGVGHRPEPVHHRSHPDEKQRNEPSAEPGSRRKQVNLWMLEG